MILRFLKYILLLFVFIVSIGLQAQFSYDSGVDSCFNQTLDLQYSVAAKQRNEQSEGLWLWLEAYNYFLTYHYGNSQKTIDEYINQTDILLNSIKELDNESVLYHACIADLYLFKAYTHLTINEYYSGWRSLVKANRHVDYNEKNFPDSYLTKRHQFVELIIEYLIYNYVPIRFSTKTAQVDADLLKLQSELDRDLTISPAMKRELSILSVFVQNIAFNKSDRFNLKLNLEWAEKGPLETLAYLRSLKPQDDILKKQALLKADNNNYLKVCNTLNLELAKIYNYELNDSALIYFEEFFKENKSKPDLIYAHQQLSWFYYIRKNQYYIKELELVKDLEAKSALDIQSLNEIKDIKNWHPEIVKARLLFDGGYYNKALKVLLMLRNNFAELNANQQVEFYYRLARVYHKTGKKFKALEYYNYVIMSKMEDRYYFPSYSAYYSGLIYEKLNNNEMARVYYNYCLKLDSPVYEHSIHRKARMGIERCLNK